MGVPADALTPLKDGRIDEDAIATEANASGERRKAITPMARAFQVTCEDLKSEIATWVRHEVDCDDRGEGCFVLTLPLLKPNGDSLDIGAERIDDTRWRISDLGDTHSTLFLAGVDLYEEYVRAEEFRRIKEEYRISEIKHEMFVESLDGGLAPLVFEFAHAIQSILALQFTVSARQQKRDFASTVAKFLAENRTPFEVPPEYIEGKTGKWQFNFVLNKDGNETLVKTLSSATPRDALRKAEQTVFEILDTKALRTTAEALVIADDEGGRKDFWKPSVLRIFDGYQIPVYPFLNRREDLTRLAMSYSLYI